MNGFVVGTWITLVWGQVYLPPPPPDQLSMSSLPSRWSGPIENRSKLLVLCCPGYRYWYGVPYGSCGTRSRYGPRQPFTFPGADISAPSPSSVDGYRPVSISNALICI